MKHSKVVNANLKEIKPFVRKLVTLIKDYENYAHLCKNYQGRLDTQFVVVASARLSEFSRELFQHIENKVPAAEDFMKSSFYPSAKEFNQAVKKATEGSFDNFDAKASELLQQVHKVYLLVKGCPLESLDTEVCNLLPGMVASKSGSDISIPHEKSTFNSAASSNSSLCIPVVTANSSKTVNAPVSTLNRALSSRPVLTTVRSMSTRPKTEPPKEWKCPKCTVINCQGEKCGMCGEPKPLIIPITQTTLGELEPPLETLTTASRRDSLGTLKNRSASYPSLRNRPQSMITLTNNPNLTSTASTNRKSNGNQTGTSNAGAVGGPVPLGQVNLNTAQMQRRLSSKRRFVPMNEAKIGMK